MPVRTVQSLAEICSEWFVAHSETTPLTYCWDTRIIQKSLHA